MRGKYLGESDIEIVHGRDYEINGEDADFKEMFGVIDEVSQYYGWGYLYGKEDFKIVDNSPYRNLEGQHKVIMDFANNQGFDFVRYLRKWRGRDIYEIFTREQNNCPEFRINPTLISYDQKTIQYLTDKERFLYLNQYREYFIDPVLSFYNLAKDYCDYIDTGELESVDIPELMYKLLNLYAEAIFLPCFSSDCITAEPKNDPLPVLTLEYETSYMEIQNPFRGPKVIEKSLDEDLLIIYQYLKAGMIEYEADRLRQALNEWKYEFNHHWGQQVMGALRALHALRRSTMFNNMHGYRKKSES